MKDSEIRFEPSTAEGEVTRLLRRWSDGDEEAPLHLLPLVYDDLRHTARAFARNERAHHTLPPTAVVHEAWIQLVERSGVQNPEGWHSREHFLGVAARAMRRILVDHARRRGRLKRGGNASRVPLLDDDAVAPATSEDALVAHLQVDQALERLERFAPQEPSSAAPALSTTPRRGWPRPGRPATRGASRRSIRPGPGATPSAVER